MPPLQFVVDRKEAGQTLAAVLKRRYNLSWAQSKRLIEARHIRVGGHVEVDVTRRLKTGKAVSISAGAIDVTTRPGLRARPAAKAPARVNRPAEAAAKKPSRTTAAADRPAKAKKAVPQLPPEVLVYQDDAIVVVNKPAGLTTMRHAEDVAEFGEKGQKFLTKTLAGLLPTLLGTPGRPVIAVHRLDRETSGLIVFARTQAAATSLTAQFRKHAIDRRYQALTRGTPPAGRIESQLVRERSDGRRGSTHRTNAPDAKRAVTHVKVLESLGDFAHVECRLETGRTHQIRIHLGEAGTPLCGERVYDRAINGKPKPDGSGAERPMLHAIRLGIRHPETGETMTWKVAPPDDFRELLGRLQGETPREAPSAPSTQQRPDGDEG